MNDKRLAETIKTYEDLADEYADLHKDNKEIRRYAKEFLSLLRGTKILDVGCGPGRDMRFFVDQGYVATGIDLCQRFVEIAKEHVPEAKVLKMDMRRLDFDDNSFDGLWCAGSLLHIPKDKAKDVLLEFQNVLRPKGIVFINVQEGEGEKIVERKKYKGHSKFFSYYTIDELKCLLNDCGFGVIKTSIDYKNRTWLNIFARKRR